MTAIGEWYLNIIDYRLPNPFDNDHHEDATGKTADELLQGIWARFQITQKWDRELIEHGLSSPMRYGNLRFFVDQSQALSYEIISGISNRDTIFPRRPATFQEGIERNRKVNFTDMNNDLFNPQKKEFGVADLNSLKETLPEVVALYHSETFSSHQQHNHQEVFCYRTFAVKNA
jgi:hypothetical protein